MKLQPPLGLEYVSWLLDYSYYLAPANSYRYVFIVFTYVAFHLTFCSHSYVAREYNYVHCYSTSYIPGSLKVFKIYAMGVLRSTWIKLKMSR